jgi:hypothetical protein
LANAIIFGGRAGTLIFPPEVPRKSARLGKATGGKKSFEGRHFVICNKRGDHAPVSVSGLYRFQPMAEMRGR